MSHRYRQRRRHDVPRPAPKPTVAEFVEVLEDNEDPENVATYNAALCAPTDPRAVAQGGSSR